MLDLLCMQNSPHFMIVENVVGFEASCMRGLLLSALDAAGMDMQVTPMGCVPHACVGIQAALALMCLYPEEANVEL